MNMYAEWFRKEVKIEKTILLDGESQDRTKHISDFLRKQGYREVSGTDTTLTGVRGHKFWNLANIGDPRRNYHAISVAVSHDAINVIIRIDSWFWLGTEHDTAVFVAELEMLKSVLVTERLDNAPLIEAQKRRRRSDWKTFLMLVAVGILIGVAVGVTLLVIRTR